MVLFYQRIFSVDRTFRLFTRIIMALVEMTCIIYLCGLIFADNPVPAQWNVTLPHTSINSVAFDTIMGAISILLDLAIVGVVQHTVWQLHMNNVHKIGLSLLFLLTAM